MNKVIFVLFLLALAAVAGPSYHPFSNEQKRDLRAAYLAVCAAEQERNFSGIKIFAPKMLEMFESVVIDPNAKNYRQYYEHIKIALKNADVFISADSIDAVSKAQLFNGDTAQALQSLDTLISFCKSAGLSHNETSDLFDSTCKKYCTGPSSDRYALLSSFKNVNQSILDKSSDVAHSDIENKVVSLASSMDPDSIKAFIAKCPSYRPQYLNEILNYSIVETRKSLIRHPSIERYARYIGYFRNDHFLKNAIRKYVLDKVTHDTDAIILQQCAMLFPQDQNVELWEALENKLFANWVSSPSISTAQQYLDHFPTGRYSDQIRNGNASSSYRMRQEVESESAR